MNDQERRVMAMLLDEVRKRQTKRGCAAIVVTTESRGYCNWRGGHGKTCQALNAAIAESEALLAADRPAPIAQLELLPEAV